MKAIYYPAWDQLEIREVPEPSPKVGGVVIRVAAVVRDLTRGRGADIVIDAVGAAETRQVAVSAVRRGGEVVWLGLHDDPTHLSGFEVVLGERKVLGAFAVTHHDLRTAIGLFAHGRIVLDPWVRTFPLADGVRVFLQLASDPPADYIKAVLLQ